MTTDTDLVRRLLHTIRRHGMLAGGETVLVGVSGGADSVALLRCLLTLAPTLGLHLHVVHVNHGLRADADADQAFVEELARQWGVPVSVERVTVPAGRSQSPEAEARAARYAAFKRTAERTGASRVALGHTADDQAETVLMRLLQGAGPRGLAGIPPVRGPYIRPLLEVRRHQIEAELRRLGLPWREDPTNRDPKFLRNRIRHDLLPFLAVSFDPRIVEALCRAGALTRALVTDLEALAAQELDRLTVSRSGEMVLSMEELRKLPPGVGEEILRQALVRLGERGPFRAWEQQTLRHLLEGEGPVGPRRVGRSFLERSMGQLRLARELRVPLAERVLPVPGSAAFPEIGLVIEAQAFERPAGYRAPVDPWRVAFDRHRINGPLSVRSRRPGDSFHPFGAPGSKPLKAFLIDSK
ncbi:MAG: tRNA lysidine(34) synthetase TilS, partial [Candidatus Rokubacteria bacterium]|nr:tRNA lysidine(34) synthetase TilS [Candidatus Rokubacteria bacterium]